VYFPSEGKARREGQRATGTFLGTEGAAEPSISPGEENGRREIRDARRSEKREARKEKGNWILALCRCR